MDRVPELYAAVFGTLKAGLRHRPAVLRLRPRRRRRSPRRRRREGARDLARPARQGRAMKPNLPGARAHHHRRARQGAEARARRTRRGTTSCARHPTEYDIVRTDPEDPAVMHYTSGTTGKSKGAVHVHQAVLGHYATGKYVLDLHPDDIYWCTADPGWVTGTSYGMFAPHTNGVTSVIYEGGFSASKWYEIIQNHKVDGLVHRADGDPPADEGRRRRAEEVRPLDAALHDVRRRAAEPRGCRLGREAPRAAVPRQLVADRDRLHHDRQLPDPADQARQHGQADARHRGRRHRRERQRQPPGEEGDLALRPGWPSMFRTYWNNEQMYRSKFTNGWYITGDRGRTDEDGYFWFIGRSDDVINTAGHLVGPFEVESALIEHPAVAEAGVIGKPDPVAMEIVKAFVTLKDGYQPDDKLRGELLQLRAREARPRRGAARDRLHRRPAEDALRQDHAPPAEGARARPAGRRHQHARGLVVRPRRNVPIGVRFAPLTTL